MDIEELKVSREEIESELSDLKKAIDQGLISPKNKIVQDLLKVYGHLQHNGKVIDINDGFKKAGLDLNDDPRLAIVRADARTCYLYKMRNGAAIFSMENKEDRYYTPHRVKGIGDIMVNPQTFQWTNLDKSNSRRKTAVPIIPARVSLAISCRILSENYHILFEPREWRESKPRPPKDPILGKMLTDNLFGVLATWELTDLEAKIIEGRM